MNLSPYTEGLYHVIKCEAVDNQGDTHVVYMKINRRNEFVAVEKKCDASTFEVIDEGKKCFTIQHDGKNLAKPRILNASLSFQGKEDLKLHLEKSGQNYDVMDKFIKRETYCSIREDKFAGQSVEKRYLVLQEIQHAPEQAPGQAQEQAAQFKAQEKFVTVLRQNYGNWRHVHFKLISPSTRDS